ncbi:ABC transporter ATP-binding protein [Pelagovum pacificum]|uniref:ABC transporter ATP-binding protein n=1 Tax=Pelagovum pacificum TaxID=2588711 RepID=A0A5C5GCP9_9RHOB|nr:ABC transporter ATP-binding protein [Pelagovum pacificum]QQA44304.1 ABC transporter ATP-binding protein [Pelagovum pacificum]TNY32575.1 ABC transporter ATP-binding protein [Pelagovum pacificum]
MNDPLLQVEDLRLTFTKGEVPHIIDGVSFEVQAGETLCIVGESGCGKSVTSMALMGLLPTPPARIVSGRATFEGEDLFAMTEARRTNLRGNRLAMIFQEPMSSLNPSFTIGHQIIEGIRRHRNFSKPEAKARAIEVLRMVRIPAPERRMAAYPSQLSGGMRQRVMIAMALANEPRLLIADEPTTALDVTIQAQILNLVKTLQVETGTAMILITHDLSVVAEVADRVAVMYAGKIVESGTVDQIFADPQHPYTIGLFGSVPSLGRRAGRLATIEGSVPPLDHMPKGCRFATRCPFADARCHREAPPVIIPEPGHMAACWYAPLEDKVAAA